MGLDIYLYKYEDFNKSRALEKQYRDFEERAWAEVGEYDNLTEDQKKAVSDKCRAFELELGLSKWGEGPKELIELDHPDHPDHMFKIGYFRSSYNGGGIERVLKNLGLPTLCDIFQTDGQTYHLQPDWSASLERCKDAIEKLKAAGAYRVNHVSANMFKAPEISSEAEAFQAFTKELKSHRDNNCDYNYSNSVGEFSIHEPNKVLAMIPGTYSIFREMPCVYVITESDNSWYITALEIVKATIEFVLAKEDKEKYYLHWSG